MNSQAESVNDCVWDLNVIYCILTAVVALKMGREAVKVPQYSEFTTKLFFVELKSEQPKKYCPLRLPF